MFAFTLLKTLYHEIVSPDVAQNELLNGKGLRFHSTDRTYDVAPDIRKVTVEKRYLLKSVLYYVWVNDKETDLNDPALCQWILAFFREFRPSYLKEEIDPITVNGKKALLDCFAVDKIPSYRKDHAYSDLEITTMKDVREGKIKKDTRQATFPGMIFSEKHKKD